MYKVYYRFRSDRPNNLVGVEIEGPYVVCKDLALKITASPAYGKYIYQTKDSLELSDPVTRKGIR